MSAFEVRVSPVRTANGSVLVSQGVYPGATQSGDEGSIAQPAGGSMAWQRSPRVVYEIVDGLAVLVDPEGTELITLNAVGTLVWEELDGTRESSDLAEALVDRLEGVGLSELERDISSFLAEVEAVGLISRGDDRIADGAGAA